MITNLQPEDIPIIQDKIADYMVEKIIKKYDSGVISAFIEELEKECKEDLENEA